MRNAKDAEDPEEDDGSDLSSSFVLFCPSHLNSQVLCVAGMTGHTEVVRVVFYPDKISFASLLKVFWESHNPTQGTAPYLLCYPEHVEPN